MKPRASLLAALAALAFVPFSARAASPSLVLAKTASGKTVRVDPFKAVAVIRLAKGGTIDLRFYPKEAPLTVANFIKLAEKGFYDGLTFHRVIPGFVAQGGDPKGDGSGGPGYTIPAEFNFHKHVPGAVGMARMGDDPNSAGSQFYICLGAAPWLDGKYTIFAHVVGGTDPALKAGKSGGQKPTAFQVGMEVARGIRIGDVMKTVRITGAKVGRT